MRAASGTEESTEVPWTAWRCSQSPQQPESLAVGRNQRGEAGGCPASPQPAAPQQQEQADAAGGLAWQSVPTAHNSPRASA